MHHKTLESAVKKYTPIAKAVTGPELQTILQADEKKYNPEDINEIVTGIMEELKKPEETKTEAPAVPQFDYRNLKGDELERYLAFIETLPWSGKFEFELYPAAGIYELRLNPKTLDKESYLAGVRLKDIQPKMTTLINVVQAKDMNAQLQQNTATNTGFYYLLKQK